MKTYRELIFFAIIFLITLISYKSLSYLQEKYDNPNLPLLISSAIVTGLIAMIFYLSKMQKENWEVSEYARCKGGPYFWQGDSEEAKHCRELASTEEGRCGLASYNCPTGYVGAPRMNFVYSPLSNSEYKNERCEDRATCGCKDDSLCSFRKNTY